MVGPTMSGLAILFLAVMRSASAGAPPYVKAPSRSLPAKRRSRPGLVELAAVVLYVFPGLDARRDPADRWLGGRSRPTPGWAALFSHTLFPIYVASSSGAGSSAGRGAASARSAENARDGARRRRMRRSAQGARCRKSSTTAPRSHTRNRERGPRSSSWDGAAAARVRSMPKLAPLWHHTSPSSRTTAGKGDSATSSYAREREVEDIARSSGSRRSRTWSACLPRALALEAAAAGLASERALPNALRGADSRAGRRTKDKLKKLIAEGRRGEASSTSCGHGGVPGVFVAMMQLMFGVWRKMKRWRNAAVRRRVMGTSPSRLALGRSGRPLVCMARDGCPPEECGGSVRSGAERAHSRLRGRPTTSIPSPHPH